MFNFATSSLPVPKTHPGEAHALVISSRYCNVISLLLRLLQRLFLRNFPMTLSFLRASAFAIGLLAITSGAQAKQGAHDVLPDTGACKTSVQALGGKIGDLEGTTSGGLYRFIVRNNGLDYDVVCDPANGLLKDVARRQTSGRSER
jgi:hypothetical protein